MSENREISLIWLIEKMLLAWRGIIVSACLFGVVFAFVKYEKDSNAISKENVNVELTDYEKAQVDQVYILYNQLDDYVALSNKPIMKLDPYNINKFTIQYYVDVEDKYSLDVLPDTEIILNSSAVDIIAIYNSYIFGEEFVSALRSELGTDMPTSCLVDYLGFESVGNTFTVSLVLDDSFVVQEDDVLSAIGRLIEDIDISNSALPNYKIYYISGCVKQTADHELANTRNSYTATISNIQKQINDMTAILSQAQKEYLEMVELGYSYRDFVSRDVSIGEVSVSKRQIIKWFILGVAFGILFYCLWVFVCEVASGRLTSEDELSEYYNVKVLGSLREKKTKKNFFDFIDDIIKNAFDEKRKKYDDNKQWERLIAAINISVGKCNITDIAIVSTLSENEIEDISNKLKNVLVNKSLKMTVTGGFLNEADALVASYGAEGILFIEKINKSKFNELDKAVKLAMDYDMNIIGAIVVND